MKHKDGKKHRILILEDERQLALAVHEAFDQEAFDPIVVATAEDGIKELEKNPDIDVIWLDHYLLGSGNGLDFVVQAKNHPKWKNIPIFVVSNTASLSNIRSYIQLGVTQYYTKSDYDIKQIINDIKYTLESGTH